MLRVAILADSHGLLRPRVLEIAAGCDCILHAGDVGDREGADRGILAALGEIAPVTAVRGDKDRGELAELPAVAAGELGGLTYRMTHRRQDVEPAWPRSVDLIVFGHSHRPELAWQSGALLLNPGAVGPRRFRLPLTMARVTLDSGRLVPEILAVD